MSEKEEEKIEKPIPLNEIESKKDEINIDEKMKLEKKIKMKS
jgi:hypothetical protein